MSIRKYLKDDMNFVLFSEIYYRYSSPKAKREALNILNGAIELFARKGFQTTTLSMVAKRYGSSTTKVLYYFGSLEELRLSAIKYTRYLFQSYVVEQMEKGATPRDKFLIYFECCLTWPRYFGNHTSLWVSFLHLCTLDDKLKAINTAAVIVGSDRLTELIRAGKQMGEFACDDEKQSARMIQSLLTGLLLSNASEEHDQTNSDLNEAVKSTCLVILQSKTACPSSQ